MVFSLRLLNIVVIIVVIFLSTFLFFGILPVQAQQTCASQSGSCIDMAPCPANLPRQILPLPSDCSTGQICCAPQICYPAGTEIEGTTCTTSEVKCCPDLYCTDGAVLKYDESYDDSKYNPGGPFRLVNRMACVKAYKYDPPPAEEIYFKPQVSIPGSITIGGKEFKVIKGDGGKIIIDSTTIGKYFALFYKFFVAALTVIAVVMVMWGGFKRIMAAGSPEKVKDANDTIMGAITGLVLALISYSLLSLVNPALIVFEPLQITPVQREDFTLEFEEPITVEVPTANLVEISAHSNLFLDGDTRKYPYLREDTLEKLLLAADLAKNQNIVIEVNYAARTLEEQERLYKKNCPEGKCNPPTCNPRGSINRCPHTTGAAVDVVCQGKKSADPCQNKLEAIMLQAGFCRLTSEVWHFEYPHFSGKCTIKR